MNNRLVEAFRIHQSGNLALAEELYRKLLEDEAIALHVNQLLGALLLQKKQPKSAIPHLETAVKVAPDSATILNNLAIAYVRSDRPEEAVATYLRSASIEPGNVETLKNLAEVLIKLKRYQAAVDVLNKAIAMNPTSALLLFKYGLALYHLERNEEAGACFDRILSQDPNHFNALLGLGRVLLRQPTMREEAVVVWRKLTEAQPTNPAILNNYGSVLKNSKEEAQAEEVLRRALLVAPEFLPAVCNLGIVLAAQGRYEAARDCFRKGTAMESNRSADSEIDLEGENTNPNLIDELTRKKYSCIAYSQLAMIENILGNFAEAEVAIARALKIDPEHADSHMIRAFLRLQQGDFLNGWREHEWRKRSINGPREFPVPEWKGESNLGQTVLIHAEQGLGDTMHFVRYAKLVKQRVGKVVLLTPRPLAKILRSCPEIDEVVEDVDHLPPYDRHIAMMSLPFVFQTTLETVPSEVPYLHAAPHLISEWRRRLKEFEGVRVGIVWQGNRAYGFDRDRSIPLRAYKPLSEVDGVNLISLQNGYGLEQLDNLEFKVTRFRGVDEETGAFMDTAAIIMNLDLVISPDTSATHLAGGLGRPVWLAKGFYADWRWMSDDRETNPWYPNVRLFHQKVRGNWEPVFQRMAEELAKLVESKNK